MNIRAAFKTQEDELHSKMHPSVAGVLSGKSLCTLRELLKLCGHADCKLVDDIANGFDIVGDLGTSGVLVPCLRSAAISVDELKGHSSWVNRVSAAKAAGQPQDARQVLWEATIKEVEQGALVGPLTSEE
eukprot:1596783-Amphidinium_carterae.1